MDITAIIQARMTSTRLPGKVLADLGGRPVLEYMIGRVRRSKVARIVVATTVHASDDPLVALCGRLGIPVFRGSEADVLGRFWGACQEHASGAVMRLTADCPLIDPALLDELSGMFAAQQFDYLSNTVARTYPDGLDAEIFTRSALQIASREAQHPYQREHVTPYLYGAPQGVPSGAFRVGQLRFAADLAHIRWTLDTAADLELLRALVARLPDTHTWLDALSVATREPRLLGSWNTQ